MVLTAFQSSAQLNMNLLSQLNYQPIRNTGTSNLWGYTDELGNEYALVGLNNGVSIVDVTDPVNPVEVYYVQDTVSIWREIKVWQNYAYVTTEADAGLLIIDLSPLPSSTALSTYRFFGLAGNQWTSAHSLFIDENGILYLHGANRGNGGVIFYDLSVDPINPPEVGQYDAFYVHDSYARGDTLYAAHIVNGFFTVLDVSNKANPIVLAQQLTPGVFTHNVWLSDDGQYLFTTDEVSGASIASYDISDLADVQYLDEVRSYQGNGSIPHNVYYKDGWLVTSYYRDGVNVVDAHDPSNLIEVGYYDVSPLTGNGFNSIWGVYPFFASGNLILSDMENGLYVIGVTYERGCFLHGTISNSVNSQPIYNASITFMNDGQSDLSDASGIYHTGKTNAGNYDVIFSRPGYYSDTVYNIALSPGDTTIVDVALVPIPTVSISGVVSEQGSGTLLPGVDVKIFNDDFTFITTTDAFGNYMFSSAYEGTYHVQFGKWGWWSYCNDVVTFASSVNTYDVELEKGYYDDFAFDNSWIISGIPLSGQWLRDVPIPTGLPDGTRCNAHTDVNYDCDDKLYMTGNSHGPANTADLDGGPAILTSPVFDLTSYSDPYVSYSRWFANYVGTAPGNDTMKVLLSNGITTVELEQIHVGNTLNSSWLEVTFQVNAFITPTATMQLIFSAEDNSAAGASMFEVGVDKFYTSEGNVLGNDVIPSSDHLVLYPNPASAYFMLDVNIEKPTLVEITDLHGRVVQTTMLSANFQEIHVENLAPGLYFVRVPELGQVTTLIRR